MVWSVKRSVFTGALTLSALLLLALPAAAQDAPPAEPVAAEPTPTATPDATPAATPEAEISEPLGERQSKNSVFLEALGPGLLYSINYDRLVIDDLAARIGFSYWGASASAGDTEASVAVLFFPITASYVGLYSGSHGLEAGGGGTLIYASGEGSAPGMSSSGSGIAGFGTLHVGYRLQPVDYGFQFRIGLMALMGPGLGLDVTDPDAFGVLPWGYMSLGGSF